MSVQLWCVPLVTKKTTAPVNNEIKRQHEERQQINVKTITFCLSDVCHTCNIQRQRQRSDREREHDWKETASLSSVWIVASSMGRWKHVARPVSAQKECISHHCAASKPGQPAGVDKHMRASSAIQTLHHHHHHHHRIEIERNTARGQSTRCQCCPHPCAGSGESWPWARGAAARGRETAEADLRLCCTVRRRRADRAAWRATRRGPAATGSRTPERRRRRRRRSRSRRAMMTADRGGSHARQARAGADGSRGGPAGTRTEARRRRTRLLVRIEPDHSRASRAERRQTATAATAARRRDGAPARWSSLSHEETSASAATRAAGLRRPLPAPPPPLPP